MHDNLTIDYEVFEEEGVKVLTVGRGDEALWQFHDDVAEAVHDLLIGNEVEARAWFINHILKEGLV